jgi:phosphonate transport system substrate-binding protein
MASSYENTIKSSKENMMKTSLLAKRLTVLTLIFLAGCTSVDGSTSLTTSQSSAGTSVTPDPDTLVIQFVPSVSIDTALLTKVKNLEDLLEGSLTAKGFNKNINISIGTSYASVIEAMASGQVHAGFLTAQQYAFTTLEYPGKVDVLLTSVRNAYNAQLTAGNELITNPATILANMNAEGYTASTTSATKVSSYYSMLLVRNAQQAEVTAAGGWDKWIKGKTVATQSVTSGSGYVYPAVLLDQNDLKFVNSATRAPSASANEVGYKVVANHQNSVLALLNNEVDAVFTFMDARSHATAYNAWNTSNPGKTVIGETKAVALTPGIYNDTISTITSLSPALRTALGQSFIDVIATTAGAEALAIYNHTGYLFANDADYNGERAVYQFLNANS